MSTPTSATDPTAAPALTAVPVPTAVPDPTAVSSPSVPPATSTPTAADPANPAADRPPSPGVFLDEGETYDPIAEAHAQFREMVNLTGGVITDPALFLPASRIDKNTLGRFEVAAGRKLTTVSGIYTLALVPDHESKQKLLDVFGLSNDDKTLTSWKAAKTPYKLPATGTINVAESELYLPVQDGKMLLELTQLEPTLKSSHPVTLNFNTALVKGYVRDVPQYQITGGTVYRYLNLWLLSASGKQTFVSTSDLHVTLQTNPKDSTQPVTSPTISLTFDTLILAEPGSMGKPVWTCVLGSPSGTS